MMKRPFKTIGLIGKANHSATTQTLRQLYHYLNQNGYAVLVEEMVGTNLDIAGVEFVSLTTIGQRCDLAIVIGGDGNMLGSARVLARYDIAVVGVNRGNLGFLADLDPED